MSISLPRFTRRETPLLGRSHRTRAIVFAGLRREFRRPASIFAILPLAITPIVAALLGFFAWSIALHALGLSLVIGFVLTAFYTSIALFLSSLTSRKAYAAAGIFAVTFGLTIPAQLLASAINQPALLYLSPWEDFLAVARGAFGVGGGPIDWAPALIILLGETVFASLATYVRMRALEVITG